MTVRKTITATGLRPSSSPPSPPLPLSPPSSFPPPLPPPLPLCRKVKLRGTSISAALDWAQQPEVLTQTVADVTWLRFLGDLASWALFAVLLPLFVLVSPQWASYTRSGCDVVVCANATLYWKKKNTKIVSGEPEEEKKRKISGEASPWGRCLIAQRIPMRRPRCTHHNLSGEYPSQRPSLSLQSFRPDRKWQPSCPPRPPDLPRH